MQEVKEKGGFGVPNGLLYYRAAALALLKEWFTLEDRRLLKLEGHDLALGWNAFLWYEKVSTQKYFKQHWLRAALLKVWDPMYRRFYIKKSRLIVPLEAFTLPNVFTGEELLRYQDILDEKDCLNLPEHLSWWNKTQLESINNKDKRLVLMTN